MKYVYGPVPSWRLGRSLGVDLISGEKSCTFDCNYCQLGKTVRHIIKRGIFVPTSEIIKELEGLPRLEIDYITLSGTGEPTLAANLGEVVSEIKKRFNVRVAALTNSSLLHDPKVRKDLGQADLVVAKLDAPNEEVFNTVNKPTNGFTLRMVVEGIKKFNQEYPRKLALQIMFVPQNKDYARDLAELAKGIGTVEVQINTPLRPCPIKPLPPEELSKLKELFKPLKVYSVYDVKRPETRPMDENETKKRRPGT
ncbi:MAG: radical SAM protein [Candidatus Margulisiibacteriota bacterium]|nr:radical SAM protein [Candidatus Margulisiibacteriota bacterium]